MNAASESRAICKVCFDESYAGKVCSRGVRAVEAGPAEVRVAESCVGLEWSKR